MTRAFARGRRSRLALPIEGRGYGALVRGLMLLASATVAAAASAAPAQDQVLMSEDEGERAFQMELGYADAVVAGDMIFLSGIVVGLREGETDLDAAYERAYRRIGAILARAGAGWGDVVDVTSFHTDVNAQIRAMGAVQRRHMGGRIPAWTAIDVDRLIPDSGITEIKIVARRPAAAAAR
jgi:enamine deaminase RidA (YjgF/YER057c/UK114 family)